MQDLSRQRLQLLEGLAHPLTLLKCFLFLCMTQTHKWFLQEAGEAQRDTPPCLQSPVVLHSLHLLVSERDAPFPNSQLCTAQTHSHGGMGVGAVHREPCSPPPAQQPHAAQVRLAPGLTLVGAEQQTNADLSLWLCSHIPFEICSSRLPHFHSTSAAFSARITPRPAPNCRSAPPDLSCLENDISNKLR